MPEKQSSTESKSGSGSSGKTAKQSSAASSKDPSQSKESSVAKEVKETQPAPVANDAQSQVQALVDRRVRNLEKRKARLETLRQEAKEGKELNEDQKKAVSKYEDVLESLEFLRDFTKSMVKIFADTQAARRKIEKEEQVKRQREEKERLKNILLFRDLLFTVNSDNEVRSKLLLQGESSSPQEGQRSETAMSADKLKHFDDLFSLVTPDRKKNDSFKSQLETAADRLISLADGKKKDFVKGITYSEIKATLLSIEKSGLLTSVASTTSTGKGSKKQQQYTQHQTSVSPGKSASSNSTTQSANTNVSTGLLATSDASKSSPQSTNTMATNVTPLPPQPLQTHISFGSLGADGRPEQDPAVVGIISSYPGGSATIPSQVFTNPNYHPQNVYVPPPTFINGPYVVQGIIPPVTQPQSQQQSQQSQPLQAGGTMNGQGILPTPDTLPESNSGDYVSVGMAGLNINDANNHVTMVNSQLQNQQTGHIQKLPGDSDFRRRDHKAQFNQYSKRNINDGRNNPKVFDHHGSSKSFQRNKQERYQGNSRDFRNGGGNFERRAGTSNRGPNVPTAATSVSGGPAGAFNKAGPK